MNQTTVIIGVGNEFRGDDGAGRFAARLLARGGLPENVSVHESAGEALALMELWAEANRAILIDAASGEGSLQGAVIRLDASAAPLPTGFLHTSSHSLSVADAIEMARALGRLPANTVLYGIGGSDFTHGKGLSAATERGCQEAAERILAELSANRRPHPTGSSAVAGRC